VVDKSLAKRVRSAGKKESLPPKIRELLGDMSAVACSSWPECRTEEMRGHRCFCCRAKDALKT